MPLSWASFTNAPRRIQNGGWAVTQDSFAVADTISGVNMRLTAGGIRQMHWHQFAEWAYMTCGACRITILDELGRYIADVKEGDLWYFPACRIPFRGSARTAASSFSVSMKARLPSSLPSRCRNGSRIRRRISSVNISVSPPRRSRISRCATSTSSKASYPATSPRTARR